MSPHAALICQQSPGAGPQTPANPKRMQSVWAYEEFSTLAIGAATSGPGCTGIPGQSRQLACEEVTYSA